MKKLLIVLGIGLILILAAGAGLHFITPAERKVESPDSPPTTEENTKVTLDENTKVTVAEETSLTFTEQKIESIIAEVTSKANLPVKVDYAQIHLDQDKMWVSAQGEALGIKAKTEGMEVRFEEKMMFVSGNVSALGQTMTLIVEAEINCESGKPSVEVKKFKPVLALFALGLSKDKISGLINDGIESAGIEVSMDLDSIRIEDGRLIVVFK